MIRVGRILYDDKKRPIYPKYQGFTQIIVMMYSHSNYYPVSPYYLKDNNERIMENIWQFSKCYKNVPETKQYYPRSHTKVIWQHKAENHLDDNDNINDEYLAWRKKGMNTKDFIRYPVGFNHRSQCKFALAENIDGSINNQKLNYIEGRKAIYLPVYCNLAKKITLFNLLKNRLNNGENLLIIEIDGPHQESLEYYKDKYKVNDDFITNNTILINEQNINIMLNDEKHPFGHGYCLAMALLGKDKEWNK